MTAVTGSNDSMPTAASIIRPRSGRGLRNSAELLQAPFKRARRVWRMPNTRPLNTSVHIHPS